jgi:hypothetical protein
MRALRNITAGDDECKQACVSAGAVPELIEHLTLCNRSDGEYHYGIKAEHSAAALYNIALGDATCKAACVEAGAIPALVECMNSHSKNALRQIASHSEEYLQLVIAAGYNLD